VLRKTLSISAALIFGAAVSGEAQDMMKGEMMKGEMTRFTIRIENISNSDGMKASDGTKWPFAMSPGLCIVHTTNAPVFSSGKKDRGKGLEAQAEGGNPATLAKSLESDKGVKSVVVFNTPVGQKSLGPIGPGAAYECSVEAAPGSKLTITSMFGQSNDLFYAPNESGIALFNNSKPLSGDITAKIILWDAGTEVNEQPGIGPNQAPRQKAPNTGKDENGVVKNIKNIKDGFTYPKSASALKGNHQAGEGPRG
jgi:hypothetical protein